MEIKKNSLHTVEFTDLTNLGCGVGHIDGMTVFADGAADGDAAEVKIIKVASGYLVGRVEKLITPSPYRIEPDCEVSKRCGGCSYRHITYEHESELKRRQVESAFRKNRVEAQISEVVTTGNPFFYRNKAEYPVSEAGLTGFYARHTHDVIPCDSCRIGHPDFDRIAAVFRGWLSEFPDKSIRHLYLRRAAGTGETMVCIVSRENRLKGADELADRLKEVCPGLKSLILNINPDDTNVILGRKCVTLWGSDTITDVLRGLKFIISPLSFYQVNHDGAELLYGEAIKRVRGLEAKKILDLYCGTGTIGLCVLHEAGNGASLTGVEIVPDAIENAKKNAAANGISNARFICGDAMCADVSDYDCIVTDPPRKGMSPGMVEKLINEHHGAIVYISCNPDTLARDAALLIRGGYRIGLVTPVDMFPRTGAIECCTMFLKGDTRLFEGDTRLF